MFSNESNDKIFNDSGNIKIIKNNIPTKLKIINKKNINKKYLCDKEFLNMYKIINENENKNLEELIKGIDNNNKINIKALLDNFENNGFYKIIFKNVYDLLNNIIGNKTNLDLNVDELLDKMGNNKKIKTEFKDFLFFSKELLYFYDNNILKEYSVIKNKELNEKKIYNVMIINDKLAVLDEESIKFYNIQSLDLIANLEFNFGNKIIKLKDGNIMGKSTNDNYAIIINPLNLENKKKIFSNSFSKNLEIETSDEKIILSGQYDLYIYSKFKDIYVLIKIINKINTSNVYQFEKNSIIIKLENKDIYEYSLKDFDLIKFKNNEDGDLIKVNENLLISHKYQKNLTGLPKLSIVKLINAKTFENIFIYETDVITSMKVLDNDKLIIGRVDGGLFEFQIIKNSLIIEEKILQLLDKNECSSIENIQIIDPKTILFISHIYYRKNHIIKAILNEK